MRTAKQMLEIFSAMKPESKVWVTWYEKEEVIERVQEHLENLDEDELDNLGDVTAEQIVTDDFFEIVMDSFNSDDYLWERFSESFSESVFQTAVETIKEITADKELWDTETEKTNAGA